MSTNPSQQPATASALPNSAHVDAATGLMDLVSAQLPLVGGLRAIAGDTSSNRLSNTLNHLADRLARGEQIEAALPQLSHRLPATLESVVRACARSERSTLLLIEYLHYRGRLEQLRQQARVASIYPACVLATLAVTLGTLVVLLGEPLVGVMQDFAMDVPVSTQMFSSLSQHSKSIALVAALLLVTLLLVWRFVLPAVVRARVTKELPLFGPFWRSLGVAQWCKLMALELDTAATVPSALRSVADALDDRDLAVASTKAATIVETGTSLGEATARQRAFPPSLPPMLRWAEQHQQLAPTLHSLAELFETRSRWRARLIELALPALVFLLVVWSCVFVLTTILTPLVTMINWLA